MQINEKINIISWNSQSIAPKLSELSHFVDNNDVKIILIQETWLTPKFNLKFRNFKIYRHDRLSDSTINPHGGVAILVHPSVKHKLINKCSFEGLESIFVEIEGLTSSFDVGCVYCPPAITINRFKRDVNTLLSTSSSCFIAGDWNSKHKSWNNQINDRRGIELKNLIDHHSFKIQAPNGPTLFPCRGNPSIVDFGITKNFDFVAKTSICNELSSDHLPLMFQVDFSHQEIKNQIFDFKKANWKKFREDIEYLLRNNELTEIKSRDDIDKSITFLNEIINISSKKNIPLKNPYFFRYPSSPEIVIIIKNRNFHRKKYQQTGEIQYKHIFNNLSRLIKHKTSEFNQLEFDKKIKTLNHFDYSMFVFARCLKNKKTIIPPLVNENGVKAYADEDKALFIAKSFESSHLLTTSLISSEEQIVEESIQAINESQVDFLEEDSVSLIDIQLMVKRLKSKKANGFDNISNRVIKNLPNSVLFFLTEIFNTCLKLGYFPLVWKVGKVVAIPKPGKDTNIPSNYRPITLLSSLGKLLERIILNFLSKHESSEKIFIPQQFGFRAQHSTTHQVLRITKNVSTNFNKNKSTGMILLDIEKAFDSVWHKAILHKLLFYNYPMSTIKIIQSFLYDRKSFVQVNSASSECYNIPAGVPQGSLLSPHIFNIFINDIPKPRSCRLAIYADDSALIANVENPRNLNKLNHILANGLNELKIFFDKWKIKLNNTKTEAILFTHSRIMENEKLSEEIQFLGQNLEWKEKVKYLGVILDRKLLFKDNINHAVTKAKKAMVALYPLLKKGSFLNIKSKRILYTSYIRSILTYACPVFVNCAKTHISKLQIIQNKNLRMILSAPYATRIVQLHEELEMLSINEFINKLTIKFYLRAKNSEFKVITNLDDYSRDKINFRIKHRLPRKMGIKF